MLEWSTFQLMKAKTIHILSAFHTSIMRLFSELKNGDKFIFDGWTYQKIDPPFPVDTKNIDGDAEEPEVNCCCENYYQDGRIRFFWFYDEPVARLGG